MLEQGRRASTYENARQIKSEQVGILVIKAWQGGALPLSYTRTKVGSNNRSHPHQRKIFCRNSRQNETK